MENKMTNKSKHLDIITNKLSKINESFTVNMYDNGYMLEVSGRDHSDDYSSVKVLVITIEELTELIKGLAEVDRDN
jgi:ribosomal protein S8